YRSRFKDLVPKSGSSPNRRRAGTPPSDGSNDGGHRGRMNNHVGIAEDNRDDEFDESPSRLDPLKFDDVKSITLRRSKLVKWFMEPFFEDLVSGCFVRLGIGKTKSGTPKYRLCIVRNVDANDPDRQYKLESYETCKYLNVVWDNEANAARWQMTQVSDSPVLEEEFKEWLQEAEKNGVRIPTRQEVLEKKEDIIKLEEMNRKNRAENFKNASEMKAVNTSLKAGEAGYDPFSRRWTRSRNYYAAKPEGEAE
uniref:Plus3 domain-containing protein n=1 Tax=Aegilops tauschii subsp. strangulata TaxID=200361 RepID=A0A453K284_AEGTS